MTNRSGVQNCFIRFHEIIKFGYRYTGIILLVTVNVEERSSNLNLKRNKRMLNHTFVIAVFQRLKHINIFLKTPHITLPLEPPLQNKYGDSAKENIRDSPSIISTNSFLHYQRLNGGINCLPVLFTSKCINNAPHKTRDRLSYEVSVIRV